MNKSLPCLKTSVLTTFLALIATNTYAGLVEDKHASQRYLSDTVNFYLTEMTTSNIAVKENTRIAIPIDLQHANSLQYAINTNNPVISAQLTENELILSVGNVEEDSIVDLSLVNEQYPSDQSYSITVNVINVPTYAISNYANVNFEELLLSGKALGFERDNSMPYAGWQFGLASERRLSFIDQSALDYGVAARFSGKPQSAGLSGSFAEIAGRILTQTSSNNPHASNPDDSANEFIANDLTTMPSTGAQLIRTAITTPSYVINYQPAATPRKMVNLVRHASPYQDALEQEIDNAVQAREEYFGREPSANNPEPEQTQPQLLEQPQPEQSLFADNKPILAKQNDEAGGKMPNAQAINGATNNHVVQVSEPAGIYLLLIALMGLVSIKRFSFSR